MACSAVPACPGHEIAGVIEKVANGVKGQHVGWLVESHCG
ncbi:alcohol dehydrogenase catalytic domain-containing protein [Caballeronia sp. RCC_10]